MGMKFFAFVGWKRFQAVARLEGDADGPVSHEVMTT